MRPAGRFTFLFILSLSLGWIQAPAQEKPPVQEDPTLKPAGQWLFSDVFIYLKQGGILNGILLGLEDQAVVLNVPQGRRSIAFTDIGRLIIRPQNTGDPNLVFGMLLGAYARNILAAKGEGQPLGYMGRIGSPLGFAFTNIIFAAAGGGLFALVKPWGAVNEKRFDFYGKDAPEVQWERVRQFISGVQPEPKVHLSVMGGSILAGSTGRYNRALIGAGYDLDAYYFDYWGSGSSAALVGNWDMIRKFQVTFSLKPALEVGLAYFPLNEPTTIAEKYLETRGGDQEIDSDSQVMQTLSGSGFYAVAAYQPLLGRLPKPFSWSIGLGLGAAKIDYHLKTLVDSEVLERGYYVSSEERENSFRFSKIRPSGFVYTQFDCFIYSNLSLGLIADFVYGPSTRVPAFPEMGLSAQNLRFGNACVGFVLGMHF